jgi:hypothetical protein
MISMPCRSAQALLLRICKQRITLGLAYNEQCWGSTELASFVV